MTRDFSAARNPTGNTVPSVIGTSPKMSPGLALADDPLDPVDELDRLDAALEHGEERALAALVRRVLARHEADVGRRPGKPLAVAPRREPRRPRPRRSRRRSPPDGTPAAGRGPVDRREARGRTLLVRIDRRPRGAQKRSGERLGFSLRPVAAARRRPPPRPGPLESERPCADGRRASGARRGRRPTRRFPCGGRAAARPAPRR